MQSMDTNTAMNYAFCKVSIASVYKSASEKSELLTQVLFGEMLEIEDVRGHLTLVRCTWDGVSGWMLSSQYTNCTTDDAIEILRNPTTVLSLVDNIMATDHFIPITMGASLPNFDGMKGSLPNLQYQFNGAVIKPGSFDLKTSWVEKLITRYMHAPELFGGRSPFGIDSAALAQMVYKMLGFNLPRFHIDQVNHGRIVDFMEFCQPGDLAYFDDGRGNIGHVGVILSDCSIVHVHGRVRKDKIDHFGIWNHDLKSYSWQLRVVKRHLPDFPEDAMLNQSLEKSKFKQIEAEALAQPGMFDLD
jgi:gamma-D-glutamyl-L-lysine dipeptidyl-peptidase